MRNNFDRGGSYVSALENAPMTAARDDAMRGSPGSGGSGVARILEVVSGVLSGASSAELARQVIEEAANMTGAQGGTISLANGDGVPVPEITWPTRRDTARTGMRRSELRYASSIAVPLVLGSAKGILKLYSYEKNAFTEGDLESLRRFGDLARLVLLRDTERTTLTSLNQSLQATDDRLIKEISRVHLGLRMSRNVLAVRGYEQQAISVCREIREQFMLSGVSVFLVNHAGTRLQGIAADGFTDFNIIAQDFLIIDNAGSTPEISIARSVARGESQFFSLGNGDVSARDMDAEAADSWEPGPYACIPLRAHQQTIGAIVVCDREREHILAETIATLETFADLVSLAILQARSSGDAQEAYLEILSTLANVVEMRDSYTGMHTQNVMAYAVALARAAGLEGEIIEDIRLGAILHDIGKIAVIDSVLLKSGPLLPDEYEAMKRHTVIGAEIITSAHLLRGAYHIVRHHHERWDGGGYPDGLCGNDIPLSAQIVSIADAYDAMTTNRPYRDMVVPSDAAAELRRCAGTQFSEKLVEIFIGAVIDERNDLCDVECRDEGHSLWLSVNGSLAPLTGRILLSQVLAWITPGRKHVIVDLTGVGFMMEAVLWSLQQINSKCRALDGFLIIIATGEIREQIVGSAQSVQFRVIRDAHTVRDLLASYTDVQAIKVP